MKNNTLTPQIRFKGFEEEWKKYELKQAASEFKYGLNASATSFDGIHKYLRITDIDDTSRLFKTDDITSPLIETYSDEFQLKANDIVFARTGASVGKSYIYRESDGEVYWAGFLIRASIIDEFDSYFIFEFSQTDSYLKYISITSQRSGQPGVNAEEYAALTFNAPSLSEQSAIGEYFRMVDELMAEAQREVSRLEKMKQASLQKMFPRPGESVPEVRFAGFTEDWKTVRLGDYASFSRGQGYTKNDLQESGTPIFLYGRLYTKYSTYVESVDTFSHITPSSVMSRGKEIVMPSSGETAEDIAVASAILSKGIILGGGLNIIIPKDGVESIFLALSLTYGSAHKELAKKAQGKSVVHIYNQDIADLSVSFPESLAEQAAIGEYFRNLDSLIDARRRRVAKLRDIKKACLDKMFAAPAP